MMGVAMKQTIQVTIVIALLLACGVTDGLAFFTPEVIQHGELKSRDKSVKNPHGTDGDCSVCHVAPKEDLTSWFSFASTKRKMIADPVELCARCHGKGFGHGTGKKPSIVKNDIPLAADGTITCAVTCHNMHITDFKEKDQGKFHLRFDNVKLCTSCHDK